MTQIVDPAKALTSRQVELIALYASGYTTPEIAEAKFLAPQSVTNALHRAKLRVGARNLGHLCALALEAGVIVRNGVGFKPASTDDGTVV
jgi:DNA-binding CsgD family transcriptional regulator